MQSRGASDCSEDAQVTSHRTQELVLQPQDTGTFITIQWSLQSRNPLQAVLWGCALLRNEYRCKVGLVRQTSVKED